MIEMADAFGVRRRRACPANRRVGRPRRTAITNPAVKRHLRWAATLVVVSISASRGDNPFRSPALAASASWVGNTYPGAQRWVPQDIDALCVSDDGRLFSNVHWEEGGGNCTVFKDGEVLGHAGYTHGWGHQGGYAIACNARHLFIAGRMMNEGGNLKGDDTWPPPGFDWVGVSRRPLEDIRRAAPFSGAKGGRGGTLKAAFLVVDQIPTGRRALDDPNQNIAGLAADNDSLYVSCPYDGTIKIYDAATMDRRTVWVVGRAGPLALDADRRLWMLQTARSNQPARIVALGADGRMMGPMIEFEASARRRPSAGHLTLDYLSLTTALGSRSVASNEPTGGSARSKPSARPAAFTRRPWARLRICGSTVPPPLRAIAMEPFMWRTAAVRAAAVRCSKLTIPPAG